MDVIVLWWNGGGIGILNTCTADVVVGSLIHLYNRCCRSLVDNRWLLIIAKNTRSL